MLKIYNSNLDNNELNEVEKIEKGCWINMINPTETEINKDFRSIY